MAELRQFRRRFGIHLRERGHDVKQHISRHHDKRALQYRFPVAGKHFLHRRGFGFALLFRLAVHMAFVHGHPHPQADQHQHQRSDKRNAPAPFHQRVVADNRADEEKHAVGHQQADGRAQLRKRAEPGAFALRRVFSRHQRRTAPFAAQADTLADTADAQQQRGEQADFLISRQQADANGRQPHRQQRSHQRFLAADFVAEVAEQRRTDGAREKRQRQRRERQQRGDGGVAFVEKLGIEHQHGRRRVDVVIIKFDGRANHRGDGDLIGIVSQMVLVMLRGIHNR